jgi:hypothetical protein
MPSLADLDEVSEGEMGAAWRIQIEVDHVSARLGRDGLRSWSDTSLRQAFRQHPGWRSQAVLGEHAAAAERVIEALLAFASRGIWRHEMRLAEQRSTSVRRLHGRLVDAPPAQIHDHAAGKQRDWPCAKIVEPEIADARPRAVHLHQVEVRRCRFKAFRAAEEYADGYWLLVNSRHVESVVAVLGRKDPKP